MTAVSVFSSMELVENNEKFILFKIRGSREQLIMTGVFNGNEDYIRMTKGKEREVTIFYKDGTYYTHPYGEGRNAVYSMPADVEKIVKTAIKIVQDDWDTMLADDSGKNLFTNRRELTQNTLNIKLYNNRQREETYIYKNGFLFGKMKNAEEYIKENYKILSETKNDNDTTTLECTRKS